MGEFRDDVLPLGDGYYHATDLPWYKAPDLWVDILNDMKKDLLLCPYKERKPGWMMANRLSGVLLVLPSTSEMSRQWGPDALDSQSATATVNGGNGSLTSGTPKPYTSVVCVTQAGHPDWVGTINPSDCQDAFGTLNRMASQISDLKFYFWSKAFYKSQPTNKAWELPYSVTSGKPFSESVNF